MPRVVNWFTDAVTLDLELATILGAGNAHPGSRCGSVASSMNLRTAVSCTKLHVLFLPVDLRKSGYAMFAAVVLPAMSAKCRVQSAK